MKSRFVAAAVAAGAGAFTYAAYRKEIDAANRRIEEDRQVIDSIEFAEYGDGPALLMIHGAGGGFDQGLALARAYLRDPYRVIAPSRFGYLGTPLPDDASPEAQADAHLRLLDALQIDRVPVIGVSAGGPSAMQFALRHPERCSALVLIVPMAFTPERESAAARSLLFEGVLNAITGSDFLFWTAMKVAHSTVVKTILGTPIEVYRSATKQERRFVDDLLRNILPISKRAAGLWNDAAIGNTLTRYPLEKIAVPTLLISAEDDGYQTYDSARYSAEQIPGAKFIGFANGGHLLVGHDDEVRAIVGNFLTRAPEPAVEEVIVEEVLLLV